MNNQLTLRPADECRYDALALGEVMLRFDPGSAASAPPAASRSGKAAASTTSRAACASASASAPASSPPCRTTISAGWSRTSSGRAASMPRRSSGATSTASAAPSASASTSPRRASASAAPGRPDRGHTAASQIKPGEVNWEKMFGKEGVRWFHTGGIFAALLRNTPRAGDRGGEGRQEVRHHRLLRSQLPAQPLEEQGRQGRRAEGQPQHRQVRRRDDRQRGGLHRLPRLRGRGRGRAPHRTSIRELQEDDRDRGGGFPNFKVAATTLRNVHRRAAINDWSALLSRRRQFYAVDAARESRDLRPRRRRRRLRLRPRLRLPRRTRTRRPPSSTAPPTARWP